MTMGGVAPAERRSFFAFVLLLAACCAAFLGKAVVGEVFVSTETVWQSVQPWSALEPAPPPVHNENLADQPTVWLPMQAATRAMVRDWLSGGEPPLYCGESYCGAPWLGNMSSALFSPFTWLFVALPFAPAFAICAAAKWLLAGVGTWLLARRLGVGPLGRALAGLAFAFCGFQIVWVDSCLTNVSVWAPWLLLAIERVIERPAAVRVAALALVTWQVLVGGHPETSAYVGFGASAYTLCRIVKAGEGKLAKLAGLAIGAGIGAALSVVQWWPFLEYALHSLGHEQRLLQPDLFRDGSPWSHRVAPFAKLGAILLVRAAVRSESKPRGRQIAAWLVAAVAALLVGALSRVGGLRPTMLLELVPDWFGRGLRKADYAGPLTYHDVVAGFCGGALFVFAIATALVRLPERRVFALTLVLLLSCARAFRTPGLEDLVDTVPQMATTGATRGFGIFALALVLLAAFGVDELRERPRRLAAAAAVFLCFLIGLAGKGDDFALEVRQGEIEVVAPGASLGDVPDLSDTRPSGRGATIRGRAPPGTEEVRLTIHGVEKARIRTQPPEADGLRPFEWTFVGSERLDPGAYRIEAWAIDAPGGAGPAIDARDGGRRFAVAMARLERPPRPSSRWIVHLGALAVVMGAALFVRSGRGRGATLLLVTLVELGFFGLDYNETTPRDRLPAAVEPLPQLAAARETGGPFRVFTARTHLHPNLHLMFGVDSLRGYDALEPLDYIHVLNELYRDHVEVGWVDMDFSTLDFGGARGAALADVANVRFVLSEEPAPPGWLEVWRQQPKRKDRAPLVLYENRDALPRLFLVQRGLRWREPFPADPRACAIWDSGEEADFGADATAARIVSQEHARGRIRATIESAAGTILVASENVPGWRATLDGAPVEVRRTHGTFLSVVIPASGTHDVVLEYRPTSVVAGARVSAAGLLALLAVAAWSLRRFFRRPAGLADEA